MLRNTYKLDLFSNKIQVNSPLLNKFGRTLSPIVPNTLTHLISFFLTKNNTMKPNLTLRLLCLSMLFSALVLTALQAQTRQPNRSIDGTGNNLSNNNWGAANIPFFRELPTEYGSSDPKNAMGGQNRPTPRAISNLLSNEPQDIQNVRNMAGMFYIWGQFVDHDITIAPTGTESVPIKLPPDEPLFTKDIPFKRSLPHPGTGVTTPREQTNLQTAWIDGSHVYGATTAVANWIRTFKFGKLKVSKGNLLPFNTSNGEFSGTLDPTAPKMDDDNNRTKVTFAAGDPRAAEHPGLTCLHTLFVREHNRICDSLKIKGMTDDEAIYQKARKEVGAILQAITFQEWLPSLGVVLPTYSGYKSTVRPDIRNLFSAAAYRWHTMVENDIIFRDNDCKGVGPVELPLKDVFFNISIVRTFDIGVLLKGLSIHRQYETDLKVNNGLRNTLFGPVGLDLVSINLQRGRDHGLPDYNKVRRFYTGSAANAFSQIATTSSIARDMASLYGSVDNIDLWAGLYAEPHMTGASVGKTVAAIISTQFSALRDGDYYYYLNDPTLVADRTRLNDSKLGNLIARNSTAGNLQSNVFFIKPCVNGDITLLKSSVVFAINAQAEAARIRIEWASNLTSAITDNFIVQKFNPSTATFDNIAFVSNAKAKTEGTQFVHYDDNPSEGENNYKISTVLSDGSTKETEVKKVVFTKLPPINIYPNPAESEINLDLKDYAGNEVTIFLYNALGHTVEIKHIDVAMADVIKLDVAKFPVGQYFIRVAVRGKKDVTKPISITH